LQTTTPRCSIQEWRRRRGCGQADLRRRRDYISMCPTLQLSHTYVSRCCGCAVLHVGGPASLRRRGQHRCSRDLEEETQRITLHERFCKQRTEANQGEEAPSYYRTERRILLRKIYLLVYDAEFGVNFRTSFEIAYRAIHRSPRPRRCPIPGRRRLWST
jgi:hypothetical protein